MPLLKRVLALEAQGRNRRRSKYLRAQDQVCFPLSGLIVYQSQKKVRSGVLSSLNNLLDYQQAFNSLLTLRRRRKKGTKDHYVYAFHEVLSSQKWELERQKKSFTLVGTSLKLQTKML